MRAGVIPVVLLLLASAAAPQPVQAQSTLPASTPVQPSLTAGQAWQSVRQNFAAGAIATEMVDPSPGKQNLVLADQARDFYRRFPQDSRAREARKLEVTALLGATIDGNPATEARLQAMALAFESDSGNSERDRAIVAGFHYFHVASRNIRRPADEPVLFEGVARRLMQEFPTQPQGYESLLTLAHRNDEAQSRALANELLGSAAADGVKAEAQKLLTQLGLKDCPLSSVAPALAGALAGKPAVIYVWASWSPDSLALAQMLGTRRLDAATWIGLNVDDASGQDAARKAAAAGQFPGQQMYDNRGMAGPLAASLGVSSVPWVCLVDSQGVIRDVRGLDDLATKLALWGL